MAEPWIKIGTEILRNPKVGAAGADGLLIFIELLASCIRGDRDGLVPARYSDAKHLSGLLFLFKLRPSRVAKGLQTLETVGLIERLPTGGFLITGWDDYWKPPYTASERKAKERERRRQSVGLQANTDGAPPQNGHAGNATESQPARDPCHDRGHDAKVGRVPGKKEGRKEGELASVPVDGDPIDEAAGVRRSFVRRAVAEAERLASRESHPLGVNGFVNARIAIEWHRQLKGNLVSMATVPICYLDYILDPKTRRLLPLPLDPAHEAGKLAVIRDDNRKAHSEAFPLFAHDGTKPRETA